MYTDNTLTPKESVRLCALGTLASQPMTYSGLANAIRHFVNRVMGPSLDVLGTSVELLRYEGLVEDQNGTDDQDETLLAITEAGRAELGTLLTANVRPVANELNKLIVALKFRFMHFLDADQQQAQAELLVDMCENELARLDDLRRRHADDEGHLIHWLDHDISLLETRLAWLKEFRDTTLPGGA